MDTTSNEFQLFKVDDSNFLTDNGTSSTAEEFNDIFDRYWALDPYISEQPLYGALDSAEIAVIVDKSGVPNSSIAKQRFNWEMELSCGKQPFVEEDDG